VSSKDNNKRRSDLYTADSWQDVANLSGERAFIDTHSAPRVKGLRVLLLGDSPPRLAHLQAELRAHGVNALTAPVDGTGYREALRFAPDAAISQITRPGEPGWWMLKRFHRHPLLRWTPALLMKWWEEREGVEIVQTDRVLERLAEALTPVRLLEERIAAGRNLADRVDLTGMSSLLRVFNSAGLSGRLSVNDSWNVFDVDFENGHARSILRRGVGGDESEGDLAFVQLLLCDSGHWTFRAPDSGPRPHNLFLPLEEQLERAAALITRFIGPEAMLPGQRAPNFTVSTALCQELANTLGGASKEVLETIASGGSEVDVRRIVGSEKDRVSLERAAVAMLRAGALLPYPDSAEAHLRGVDAHGERAVRAAESLFRWLSEDHRAAAMPAPVPVTSAGKRQPSGGHYSLTNVDTDRVLGNPDRIRALGEALERTRELTPPEGIQEAMSTLSRARRSGELDPQNDSGWRRRFQADAQPASGLGALLSGARAFDSLPPSASPEERSRAQMWVALIIALVLIGLLIAGLVYIGSGPKAGAGTGPTPSSPSDKTTAPASGEGTASP
jgi:hypothetical protein